MAQTTKTAQMTATAPAEAQLKGALVVAQERLPYPQGVKERFGIDRASWRALCESIWPLARSSGSIVLALAYCRARKLDPFKRVVHIVPMWNAKLKKEVETVWPGIAEHRTTACRTGAYAGCDPTNFGPTLKQTFKAKNGQGKEFEVKDLTFPEFAQITVYRIVQGQRVAFPGPKVYFIGTFGRRSGAPVPNEKWAASPSYMLEKCAEAAALRKAFPEELGSDQTAEEMEGRVIDQDIVIAQVDPPDEPRPQREDFKDQGGDPRDGFEVVDDRPFGEGGEPFAQNGGGVNDSPAPEAQGSAPADTSDKRPETADTSAAPVGADASPPAEGKTGVQIAADRWASGMGQPTTLGELSDFKDRARAWIDGLDVSAEDRAALWNRIQLAALERERTIRQSMARSRR